MRVYLEKKERDRLFQQLNNDQREYVNHHLKRSKRTYYANFIAKLTASQKAKDKTEDDVISEILSWQLIDYIDAGAVSPTLKCECGKNLRYQYIIQNKVTGEIRKFGATHLQEHTGFPPQIAKEIIKGLQEIDFELDEILAKRRDGWRFPLPNEAKEFLPDELLVHIELKLPFTNKQEKEARELLKKWEEKKRKQQNEKEQLEFSEEIVSITLPSVSTTLPVLVQQAVLYYFEKKDKAGLIEICDWLIDKKIVKDERFYSGKAKIYPHVGMYLDQLTEKGRFERSGDTTQWFYEKK